MQDFLNWLTSPDGGALLLVLWAVSWGLEDWGKWNALPSKIKSLIILGVSALIAVLAVALGNNPGLVDALDPYFTPISYVVLAWLATQTAHKIDLKIGSK